MFLGYEWRMLLKHEENASEVAEILTILESDLVSEETLEYRKTLIDRLLEIGESKIYKKAEEREETLRKNDRQIAERHGNRS
jgi:hypothetical protein